jgi:hypothetical protein
MTKDLNPPKKAIKVKLENNENKEQFVSIEELHMISENSEIA